MKTHEFVKLSQGDIVRQEETGDVYVVMANYGGRVTAVRTVDMTNADEWNLVSKASYRKRGGDIDPAKEHLARELGTHAGEAAGHQAGDPEPED